MNPKKSIRVRAPSAVNAILSFRASSPLPVSLYMTETSRPGTMAGACSALAVGVVAKTKTMPSK